MDIQQTWKTYQDAWADIPTAQRQSLLARSVAEDCTFTSPDSEGRGLATLAPHIEAFQQQYPGASFITHTLIAHHAQLLAEWTMYNKDGSEFLKGTSYARFNADGLLTHLAGFWQL